MSMMRVIQKSGFGSTGGGLTKMQASVLVADDDEIIIPAGKVGWGFCQIGDNQEYGQFTFDSSNVVTSDFPSSNFVTTDTDLNLCVYDNGVNVAMKNRLGSALILRYLIYYS